MIPNGLPMPTSITEPIANILFINKTYFGALKFLACFCGNSFFTDRFFKGIRPKLWMKRFQKYALLARADEFSMKIPWGLFS